MATNADHSILPAIDDIIASDKITDENSVDVKYPIYKLAHGASRKGNGLTAGARDGLATTVSRSDPFPTEDYGLHTLLKAVVKELKLANHHLSILSNSPLTANDLED